MLHSLVVYLIMWLVSMSGKVWAENLPPKTHNNFVFTSFCSTISPMVLYLFCEKWEVGVWNQGIFGILFCVVSTTYLEFIQDATISQVFPTYLYLITLAYFPVKIVWMWQILRNLRYVQLLVNSDSKLWWH